MKITKTTTVKEEIEVTFPHYSKDNVCHWYKAISEDKMIKIFHGSNDYCTVDFTEYNIWSAFDEKCVKITEKEFNDKFFDVVAIMSNNI